MPAIYMRWDCVNEPKHITRDLWQQQNKQWSISDVWNIATVCIDAVQISSTITTHSWWSGRLFYGTQNVAFEILWWSSFENSSTFEKIRPHYEKNIYWAFFWDIPYFTEACFNFYYQSFTLYHLVMPCFIKYYRWLMITGNTLWRYKKKKKA